MFSINELVMNLGLAIIILGVSHLLWNYLSSPLKIFPGPFWASFTNLWRLQDVFRGRCDITHNQLHRKFGTAVRMGPNVLSLSDPSLIPHVFNSKNPWMKSNMYNVNDVIVSGVRLKNLFSNQDEKWHSTYIRPVKGLYSMTKVQEMEPGVDMTINLFMDILRERFVEKGRPCDMADYLNFFAWDVMSEITFSENLGILEAGSDHQGFLSRSNKSLDYFAPISQMPVLDLLLDKNPIVRLGPPTFVWANIFSLEQLQKRLSGGTSPSNHTDFLDKFLETKKKYPDLVNDNTVVGYLLSNTLAGSDTTGSTMCSAVYHILKHPRVYRKLCDELYAAKLPLPARWKDLQGLTYLDAVMRESMRVNPGVGLMLERIVPEGGFTLPDGRFIPEGTIVGMNPWVINKNEAVFGANTEDFIPERWLPSSGESEEAYQARFSKMKSTDFSFGAGPRMCMGRYLSQLESYKLIATLFSTFEMELASLDHMWHVTNSWFVRHEDIPVKMRERTDLAVSA
ncbi:benzoate 4-monooxygenase cytochrome P450 [Aspergillus nomiae NRRL 13137]|uniref:Benzoate 4-monooxygenase cytochrome P450 n=1 Tax=Aspergillus nomiae NRRL (strain ATCC 15546 / NRRL 13137 / CBS 260.88 / M93) TaxID=1509407 RepID=A0A0L1J0H9_ASPN3|nr:benzoate 4-monooxygenase cytochrome P450 [Aspergillus nomiae NRRL 13137]KNG84908.1 benzoate 4-monooxygenase cytochrome P450 [Aspergillus nomiae NRRL 13137]